MRRYGIICRRTRIGSVRDDGDYLLLSQLTHAGYCLRRVALIMNEQIWQESADTAKGRMEHERVHMQRMERRGENIKLYEYDVFSDQMQLRGKCDCIEATACDSGCRIPQVDFPVKLFPVEFKHGKLREELEYEVQLCAQAMCLEEMFDTTIEQGALFYTSSHRRYPVQFTEELRQQVLKTAAVLRGIRDKQAVPEAEYSAKCRKCSIYDICMPKTKRSAKQYCEQLRRDAEEVSGE